MAQKDVLGRAGEERAARYLRERGYVILDRNWRGERGELDIVARHGVTLAVVEVKTRTALGFGHPFEAVDRRKLDRLWRLATEWVRTHLELARGAALQIDAIAVTGADPETAELEHLERLR